MTGVIKIVVVVAVVVVVVVVAVVSAVVVVAVVVVAAATNAHCSTAQWEVTNAEIKVQSDENTELKGSPFEAKNMSVYYHACYAYCQGFLSC